LSDPFKDQLIREARRVEEDTLYSSIGHCATADRWRSVLLLIGVPAAILTGLAGLVIVGGPAEIKGISVDLVFGLIAIVGAISTAVMTFLGPEKRSTAHQHAADRYNALKGRARRFYEIDLHRSFNNEELADRLEALAEERDELNQSSPLIPDRAFKKSEESNTSRASHLRCRQGVVDFLFNDLPTKPILGKFVY
jgi:hypothetical protein